jgi:YHS domain-containing protein
MKMLKPLVVGMLLAAFCAGPFSGLAAEKKEKLKPYTLKICVVSGDKLGEMGDPFIYAYEGREIKLCCKGCLKDFKKDPAKYIKKIEEEEAKAKKDK